MNEKQKDRNRENETIDQVLLFTLSEHKNKGAFKIPCNTLDLNQENKFYKTQH